MSIESLMPSNHLILCHPLLLLPSVFPSIRVFSNGQIQAWLVAGDRCEAHKPGASKETLLQRLKLPFHRLEV